MLMRALVLLASFASLATPAFAYQLPDRRLTPGTVSSVTAKQVCAPGYDRRARHAYDDAARAMSRAVRREYGVRAAGYRIDHLVPIEAGGAPFDVRNLWPQPIDESFVKDERENAAHDRICSSHDPDATMRDVQREFETNWTTVRAS